MSSRKQTDPDEKASSKKQAREPTTGNLGFLAQQQTHPDFAIQKAKFDPGSLTSSDVIHLQRLMGNRTVNGLVIRSGRKGPVAAVQANRIHTKFSTTSNPVSDIIQRRVKITFEESEHEMEDFDEAEAKIIDVLAERDKTQVSVEDKPPSGEQRAHTTSHVVFTKMLVRDLDQKTWAEAWQMLKAKYQFLHNLVTKWYANADTAFEGKPNAAVRNQLPGLIQAEINNCDSELKRGDHPITGPLWGARLKDGGPDSWKYYDHQPGEMDDVSAETHLIKPWKLRLTSQTVGRLEHACEQWMLLRGQIPWTSVDTFSYVSGDVAGPDKVDEKAEDYADKDDLSLDEAQEISDRIIITFDFFPPSFTKTRTIEHAAAVAARHVVEHFQYHRSIKPAWRDMIAEAFLGSWSDKIEEEKNKEDEKTSEANDPGGRFGGEKKRKKKQSPGLDTTALKELQDEWDQVMDEFRQVYDAFKETLVD